MHQHVSGEVKMSILQMTGDPTRQLVTLVMPLIPLVSKHLQQKEVNPQFSVVLLNLLNTFTSFTKQTTQLLRNKFLVGNARRNTPFSRIAWSAKDFVVRKMHLHSCKIASLAIILMQKKTKFGLVHIFWPQEERRQGVPSPSCHSLLWT